MGLELEMFEGDVDEDLICGICSKVFLDPVSNCCPHVFCETCIKKRLKHESSRYCPECSMKMKPVPDQASVELKLKLLNLRARCSHQCGTVCSLGELPDHVADVCPNAPVSCPNMVQGCRKKIKRCEVDLHLEECDHRYVDCEACGYRVQYCELFTHQSRTRCLERKLRQQVARAVKSTSLEVQLHRKYVTREHRRLEQHQRKIMLDHFKSKQNKKDPMKKRGAYSSVEDGDRLSVTPEQLMESEVESNQSPRFGRTPKHSRKGHSMLNCKNCKKPFRMTGNHPKACCYHAGPMGQIDLFGGTCYNCGRMDYQHGCKVGQHIV